MELILLISGDHVLLFDLETNWNEHLETLDHLALNQVAHVISTAR
jgi:hypothetical protein